MNEKIRALGKNVSEQYSFFISIKMYIVSIENRWCSIFVYGVLSLSMEFYLCLRSFIFVYGVLSLSMARLGAKYAEVGCKSMESFGCMSMPFGCMYAETVGCMYAVVGCKVYGYVWMHA